MLRPRGRVAALAVAVGLVVLLGAPGWAGSLRISSLVVTNSDRTLLINLDLVGSLPPSMIEGLGTGIPATVRFQVELWQYNSWWVDRRVAATVLERQLAYDVLTKEYRVSAVVGEEREPFVTRDIGEAERVLSEVRGLRLVPMASLLSAELYYVRARAAARAGTPDSLSKLIPFWSSGLESGWAQSPLLSVSQVR